MRYLFFDIECCDGKHICEFGYVLTDESFHIIKKRVITINPEAKFNLTGRRDGRDIQLYFNEAVYYRSPRFTYYYQAIKELLEAPDQIVIGHAITNDTVFLRIACQRYGLNAINFRFCDSQRIYNEYAGTNRCVSLEKVSEELELPLPKRLHRSDEDSETTMHTVKKMCEKMQLTLPELIDICPSCPGKTAEFETSFDHPVVSTHKDTRSERSNNNFIRSKNYNRFFQFLDGVKNQGEIIQSPLTGKSICVSKNYEYGHYREMLALVQLLTDHGAIYSLKASENDIFVRYPEKDENGEERYCTRLHYVTEAIQAGKDIMIIDFTELMKLLNISEPELSGMPEPDRSSFVIRSPYEKYSA